MKNIVIIIASIMLNLNAYSQNNQDIVKYKAAFPVGHKKKLKKFFINVPENGTVLKNRTFTGDYHTEYRIIYSDSSIIYITNDNWNGSRLNAKNRIGIGINGYTKKCLLDTIKNCGIQNDSLYWKEHILGEIVVGYVNCPANKKKIFDEAISTLRRKKRINK